MLSKFLALRGLIQKGSGGGGSTPGGGGGGMWLETGTVVFAENTYFMNWNGIPIDASKGAPEIIWIGKEVENTSKDGTKGMLHTVMAAPKIMPCAYTYGMGDASPPYYFPHVADNSYAIYKNSKGNYFPINPAAMLSVKFAAGVVYRWIAIGGVSA